MKKLQYSPDAIERLHEIKQDVSTSYGPEKADAVIREMTKEFRTLQQFENNLFKKLAFQNYTEILAAANL